MLSLWAAKMVVGPLNSEVWRRRIENIYFISLTKKDCLYSQDDRGKFVKGILHIRR